MVYLAGQPELRELVSDRVHPVKLPERPTYPAVSVFRVSTQPLATLDDGPQDVEAATFQVSCWSTNQYEARRVAEQVRLELQGFRGDMGGMVVGQVLYETSRDLYDDDAQEPGVLQVASDYTVWWKNTP